MRAVLAAALVAGAAHAAPNCSLTGPWLYALDARTVITVGGANGEGGYNATCTPGCGWDSAVLALDPRPWSTAFLVTFFRGDAPTGVVTPGWVLGDCAAGDETVLYFGGTAQFSAAWCRVGNVNCTVPLDPFWLGPTAQVHLLEVSHSDIGWLGSSDDVLIDSTNIDLALALMRNVTSFVWQHECVLFLRCYVEMFPDKEAELVERIAQGRFDFGGTWTEPYEGTFVNELLARQMYVGRKYVTTRYPTLDTAVVAFHQDGPLRALQTAQVYAKAGMKYLKHSRYSEELVAWTGADGVSSLVTFPQLHYCTGASQWEEDTPDILYRLALYASLYKAHGLPPILGVTWGCDYAPPDTASGLMAAWGAAGGEDGTLPPLLYSSFKNFLDALTAGGGAAGLPVVQGERPNIWLYEATPTHHWMFSDFRNGGGRLLPAAEAFSTFAALALAGSFDAYPADALGAAWLNVTLDDHGISGEPVPKDQGLPSWLVNDNSPPQWDMLYAEKWASAVSTGYALLDTAAGAIAAGIDVSSAPSGCLAAVVVVNTLSWTRDDSVVLPLPSAWGGVALTVVNAAGAPVPSQPVVGDYDGSEMRTSWGWNFTREGKGSRGAPPPSSPSSPPSLLAFAATGVPSMGYATFFVLPTASATPAPSVGEEGEVEEEAVQGGSTPQRAGGEKATPSGRGDAGSTAGATCTPGAPWTSPFSSPVFTVTPGRGGLSSVLDLSTNTELFDTRFYDAGEWMQLEYTGMGASETRAYPSPWVNHATFQRLGNVTGGVTWTATECGPVRSVFTTAPVQTLASVVQLVVAVYAGTPRLDVRVRLTNWTAPFGVVNRVVFPILTDQALVSFATAFGVSRVGTDEAEDGFHDVWLLDPPATTPKFERGYALRPRETGDWIRAEGTAGSGVGVTLSSEADVWVTAVKKEDGDSPAHDGMVVRFFAVSATDLPNVTIRVGVGRPLTSAAFTDLIEEHPVDMPGGGVALGLAAAVTMPVGHYSIETIKLGFF